MHAVRRHDGVPYQHKVNMGVLGQDLRVGRLRLDIGNLSISAKETVQSFLGQLGWGFCIQGRCVLHPDATLGKSIQIL